MVICNLFRNKYIQILLIPAFATLYLNALDAMWAFSQTHAIVDLCFNILSAFFSHRWFQFAFYILSLIERKWSFWQYAFCKFMKMTVFWNAFALGNWYQNFVFQKYKTKNFIFSYICQTKCTDKIAKFETSFYEFC